MWNLVETLKYGPVRAEVSWRYSDVPLEKVLKKMNVSPEVASYITEYTRPYVYDLKVEIYSGNVPDAVFIYNGKISDIYPKYHLQDVIRSKNLPRKIFRHIRNLMKNLENMEYETM